MNRIQDQLSALVPAMQRALQGLTSGVLTVGVSGSGADVEVPTSADAAPLINQALRGAAGRVVRLLAGRYYCASSVHMPSGSVLEGMGAGLTELILSRSFNDANFYHMIGAFSGPCGSDVSLSVDGSPGNTTLFFATSTDLTGFPVNSVAFLRSNDLWDATAGNTRKRGELVKILRVGVDANVATCSITAYSTSTKQATLTAPAGTFNPATDVGKSVTISNALISQHNGTFPIDSVDPTGATIVYFNPNPYSLAISGTPVAPDAHNGAIVVSGPSLSFYNTIRDSYLVASSGRICTVPWVEGVRLSKLSITQEAPLATRDTGAPAIAFRRCMDVRIEDVLVDTFDAPGVVLESSYDVVVTGSTFRNLQDYSTNHEWGYGTLVSDACENVSVVGCHYDTLRHGIDCGRYKSDNPSVGGYGVPRGIVATACVATHCTDAAFSTHAEGEGISYLGCTAENCDNFGFFMRCRGAVVSGCTVQNCSGGIAVGTSATGTASYIGAGSVIEGNVIRHIRNIVSAASDVSSTGSGGGDGQGVGIALARTDRVVVANNVVEFCGRAGMRFRKGVTGSVVIGNTFLDCNQDNNTGSTGNAICFDTPLSGLTGVLTKVGTTMTMPVTANFFVCDVGSYVKITGCATAANNGYFIVTAVTGGVSVSYTNAAGVAGENGSWESSGSRFNIVKDNYAANRTNPSFERDVAGYARYLIFVGGTTNGDNIFENEVGDGMISGTILDTTVAFAPIGLNVVR